ncbi:MAG TPA: hypothetical protein ENJ35_02620, partial [Gammaproteobacteria bacterium]|nr:hypothetical protein [Gammaproteobacteria bacterium]
MSIECEVIPQGQGLAVNQKMDDEIMLNKQLFRDATSPYYVIAPPYTEMSSGIRVLHYLCHVLNLNGQEAYVSTDVTNGQLRTPLLTEEVKVRHIQAGREPIVIYPEVVLGNPLGARHVVRYLLNRPGALGGAEVFEDNDFILQYRREYVPDDMTVDAALYLPHSDLSLFNTDGIDESRRAGSCFFINRYKGGLEDVPEDAVEVSRRV